MRLLYKNYAVIMRVMHIMQRPNCFADFAEIMRKLCENYADMLPYDYAEIMRKLCGLCKP